MAGRVYAYLGNQMAKCLLMGEMVIGSLVRGLWWCDVLGISEEDTKRPTVQTQRRQEVSRV